MLPLGLGIGSGLGSQNSKVNRTSSSLPLPSPSPASRSSTTTMKAAVELQDVGVNAWDEKGRTALHLACGLASVDIARMLLEAGADVNASDIDFYTPLHMAAGYGRCHCVKLLLEHGADVFARERAGRTPRELAVEIRDDSTQEQEMVKVPRGDIELTIQWLADAECNSATEEYSSPVPSSNFGKQKKKLCKAALGSALTVACRGGYVDFVGLLLSSGAHVDAPDPDGATPLLAAADSGFANCVQLLLKCGANADAKDRVGVTALIAAAYNGHSECLRVLFSYDASVDARSDGGVTPLIAAAEGRHGECTQILLQSGAQVNARTSEGKTALMHAVSRNCVEAVEVLLNWAADINAADGDGCTALHHGARNNSVESLQILLEREADVTRKCRRGRTPLHEAPKDSEAAKLLEQRWANLESEIAMRQMEVLNLFAQDRNEAKSTPPKRHRSRKLSVKKKKDPVEKAGLPKHELPKAPSTRKPDSELIAVADALSQTDPPQQPLPIRHEDAATDGCTNLSSVGVPEHSDPPDVVVVVSPKWEPERVPSPSLATLAAAETACAMGYHNDESWIRVDGKAAYHHQRAPGASSLKPSNSATIFSLRASKPGESLSGDHLFIERKGSGGQSSSKPSQGVTKVLREEEDSNDSESSSSWVQALLRRNHSVGDGASTRIPHVDVTQNLSPPKLTTEEEVYQAPAEAEEKLTDRVQRIELEIEQAREADRANMEKVKKLEMLVSARKPETNSVQISDLTYSLDVQITARVQAETAKTEMEFRIRNLETVVASQRKDLELAQAEIAQLKLQMRRTEARHKQDCEVQQRESMASAMAAAAGSCRAWELHHSGLRGWSPEGTEPSPGEFSPLLLPSGYKMDADGTKPGGQSDRGSFNWKSTATAAAMTAASMLASRNCACSTILGARPSCLVQELPQDATTIDAVLETMAGQEGKRGGDGMVRSASEGSLHSMVFGGEQRTQQVLLPFTPLAGPRTDPVNGWFSLVPSPD